MSAAVRQTLKCLLVHLTAIGSFPPLFTNTRAVRAETVAGAGGMGTVHFLAILSFVAAHAIAFPISAMTMPVTIGYFAFVMSQRAFFPFPAGVALALSVYVFSYNSEIPNRHCGR